MGFNSAFKGLKAILTVFKYVPYHEYRTREKKCDSKSENPSENWGGRGARQFVKILN